MNKRKKCLLPEPVSGAGIDADGVRGYCRDSRLGYFAQLIGIFPGLFSPAGQIAITSTPLLLAYLHAGAQ